MRIPILALALVVFGGCSGVDDRGNRNDNSNQNTNGNSIVTVPGECQFPGSGAGGDVTVTPAAPVSLDERAVNAQNTVDLDREGQLGVASLGVLRFGGCGDAGLLLRLEVDGDPRLVFVDPADASALEVVEATDLASVQDAALFFDASCEPLVVRTSREEAFLEYRRDASGRWAPTTALADFNGVLGATPEHARVVASHVAPNGVLYVFVEATVSGETTLLRGARDASPGSAWSFTALPDIAATQIFGYWVDSAGQTYTLFRNTEYPCDPCNVDFLMGTLPAGASAWTTQVVQPGQWGNPNDQFVESASLAFDSSDRAYIAAHFTRRAITGSYQSTELRVYGVVDADWCDETVVTRTDGYMGDDGDAFTGANPHLLIDDAGRLHVLFLDQAVWHDGQGWSNEMRGQLRYAVRQGGVWYIRTLLSQPGQTESPDPLIGLGEPVLAVTSSGDALLAAAVRQTWQTDSIYNDDSVPATLEALLLSATVAMP